MAKYSLDGINVSGFMTVWNNFALDTVYFLNPFHHFDRKVFKPLNLHFCLYPLIIPRKITAL